MACVEKIKHDVPHCTSSKDSLQVFHNAETGKFSGFCFSCSGKGLEAYITDPYNGKEPKPPKKKTEDEINEEIQEIRNLKPSPNAYRGIEPKYFSNSGIKLALSEYDGVTPWTFNFPYTVDGKLRGYKVILLNKINGEKVMWSVGDIKNADLFNWEIAKKNANGPKPRLYVTEGEWDCRALEQMLEAHATKRKSPYNKFAVTSLPHGVKSAVATLGRMRKEIDKFFTEIVLVFDNDEAGKKAVRDVQKILPDIKVAVYPTSAVDANEVLLKGDGDLFADFCIWKSTKPVSEGVVNVSTVLSRSMEPPQMGLSYPWPELTDMVYGQRFGEATCLGAGIGVGKTLIAHETGAHNIITHTEKVFMVLLEEDNRSTLWNVAGKIDSLAYHRPEIAKDNWEQFTETARSLEGKLFLWESDGHTSSRFDIEEILRAVRFNTMEFGVRFHVIDNITRLVDHLPSGEANEFINRYSSEIANLCSELDIHIDMFSHLNTPKGQGSRDHESGGEVLASQFTGSRGIMRSFPLLMGFERNKMAEDGKASNSYISCIKNRKFGGEGRIKTQYQPNGRLLNLNWEGDSLY